MIRNFFVTALRNFRKNRSHTILNIAGLSLGLACCLVVFTIINFEYSFDNWHEKKDQVYRVTTTYYGDNETEYGGVVPYPVGKAIKENVSGIEKIVEFHGPDGGKFSFTTEDGDFLVYRENEVLMTNKEFFEVLDFKILRGSTEGMNDPNKVVLSESLAYKYFLDSDPIGRVLKWDGETNLEVVAVIEDCPDNTNLPYSSLISIATLKENEQSIWNNWGLTWAYTCYVVVQGGQNIAELNLRIDDVVDGLANPDDEEEQAKTEIVLQPLLDIHNDERFGDGQHYVTPILMIWAFIFLGVLVLGTACLNFINLSTAQAIRRSKEVGIRKTLGSKKIQLVSQFLTETFVVVLVSMLLALSLGQFLLEQFNQMLTIVSYNLQYSNEVILFALSLCFIVTILAGSYPSLILSGYQPVEALKNKITITHGSGSFNLRRSLVIAQFAFTTIMLIGTLIIAAQVRYMKNKDLGFDLTNVVMITIPEESEKDPQVLVDRLKTKPFVQGVTLAFSTPISGSNWNNSYKVFGEEYIDGNNASMKFVDENYLDFYKIPIIVGENIRHQTINDTTFNVLINKHLLKTVGWSDPEEAIGKKLTSTTGRTEWRIVGVVEDFNVHSAHNEMRPAILSYRPHLMNEIAVRLPNEKLGDYVDALEETFREQYPNDLFELAILKAQIDEYYLIEDLLSNVIIFVSFLAILLSIMGLYGLVSFMANRNAKTIGIRKVFGATNSSILAIFTKEYVKLMLISFVFAAPSAYFLMNIWIQEFAFRIDLSPWYFIIGFLITLSIALGTVSYRSLLAAKANPIQSLRYE